jgi:hypothetical protein
VWTPEDKTTFATLAISEQTQEDYIAQYYNERPELRLIDENTAPDGTTRRSYRVIQSSDEMQPGQLDVYFRTQGKQLAVLELYTADSVATNRTTLTALQLILDSWRVKSQA